MIKNILQVDWTKPHSNCILTIVHVKRNQEKHGENVYDNVVSYGHKPLVPQQQERNEAKRRLLVQRLTKADLEGDEGPIRGTLSHPPKRKLRLM